MNQPIRVLLADNHESVRQGLRALFDGVAEVEVLRDVEDGADAVELVPALEPDIVILDLSMPTSGLVATRLIKERRPDTAVVIFTRHQEAAYVREAMTAGAAGYVLKQSPFSELARAVWAAARGEQYIDPRLKSIPG